MKRNGNEKFIKVNPLIITKEKINEAQSIYGTLPVWVGQVIGVRGRERDDIVIDEIYEKELVCRVMQSRSKYFKIRIRAKSVIKIETIDAYLERVMQWREKNSLIQIRKKELHLC